MKTSSVSSLALAATSMFSSFTSAVQYLTVDGANFITNSTGDRFTMIGVDYQPGGSSGLTTTSDPLSNSEKCLRDAIMLQKLGVNLIRVYNLDVDLDHDACASIFNAAGIYMLLDVNSGTYGTYIDRTAPWTTYTLEYLKHIFGIMEAFAPYPNLLGFFAGNEIINEESTYSAPMYIRAVVRDMKDYIANNFDRTIGVGYSAADVSDMLEDTWNYLGCNLSNDTSSKIDFFGLNDYEWCGDSSYTESGYDKLVDMFGDSAIPVFFSEYGCNNVSPRTFTNVEVLYGDKMTSLSGGLVYEYSEDSNDYGLVDINSTTELTLRQDYNYLAAQYAKIDIKALQTANKTATAESASSCKASLITESAFYDSWGLPTRPSGAAAIISSGLSSPNQGKIVDVNTTAMPATVYNYTGETVTGLELTILDSSDSNYPGLTSNYTATAGAGQATATSGESSNSASSSSSSSSNSSSAASHSVVVSTGVHLHTATGNLSHATGNAGGNNYSAVSVVATASVASDVASSVSVAAASASSSVAAGTTVASSVAATQMVLSGGLVLGAFVASVLLL